METGSFEMPEDLFGALAQAFSGCEGLPLSPPFFCIEGISS